MSRSKPALKWFNVKVEAGIEVVAVAEVEEVIHLQSAVSYVAWDRTTKKTLRLLHCPLLLEQTA
jgi:hypothetical protein